MTAQNCRRRPETALRALSRVARVRPWVSVVAFLMILPITTASGETTSQAAIPTLEDITIEGEIVVPQVLFITARDQRRYDDYDYAAYLGTSAELARETVLPVWIGLAPVPVTVRLTTDRPAATTASPAADE